MNSKLPHTAIIILVLASFMIGLRIIQTFSLSYLNELGKDSLELKYLIKSGFNFIYVLGAYWAIKKYKLSTLGGLGKTSFKSWWILLFPLYLVILNFDSDLNFNTITASRYTTLALYTLSIGFSEEYLLRSFLQSALLKRYGVTKKGIVWSVIGAAMVFGVLHLVKFDKGFYGEIGQVCFATFIGVMFGAMLLRTHKVWPLIIIHALIDYAAKIDELPIIKEITDTTKVVSESIGSEIGGLIGIVLITLPCLFYGLVLLRKVRVEDIQSKIIDH